MQDFLFDLMANQHNWFHIPETESTNSPLMNSFVYFTCGRTVFDSDQRGAISLQTNILQCLRTFEDTITVQRKYFELLQNTIATVLSIYLYGSAKTVVKVCSKCGGCALIFKGRVIENSVEKLVGCQISTHEIVDN